MKEWAQYLEYGKKAWEKPSSSFFSSNLNFLARADSYSFLFRIKTGIKSLRYADSYESELELVYL